jgi:hypothetical protein
MNRKRHNTFSRNSRDLFGSPYHDRFGSTSALFDSFVLPELQRPYFAKPGIILTRLGSVNRLLFCHKIFGKFH